MISLMEYFGNSHISRMTNLRKNMGHILNKGYQAPYAQPGGRPGMFGAKTVANTNNSVARIATGRPVVSGARRRMSGAVNRTNRAMNPQVAPI